MSRPPGEVTVLFADLAERGPDERAVRLAAAPAATRDEVARLLASHDDAGGFLDMGEDRRAPAIAPGQLLCGRYLVRRRVGRGAAGEVYEAEDLELRERVALKTLRADGAGDARALERFKQEVQLARRVAHPNACRIFELGLHRPGDADPVVPFLIMEFLEGETLAERLARGPALQVGEALHHGEHIAAALAAVHAADLVHRDLKPGNVMLVPGVGGPRAVVTDFGLVRPGVPDAEGGSGLYGTADYMAPEQRAGRGVGPRSDVYSFGVVLFEMLTGRPPAEAHALAGGGVSVKTELAAVLRRCLQPEASLRYASGRELLAALLAIDDDPPADVVGPLASRRRAGPRITAWSAAAAATLALLPGTAGVFRSPRPAPTAIPAPTRIAVLPFDNLGPAEDDYFADGIADEVRGKLTSLAGLEVIARGSSTPYKKTTRTPAQVARELDVRYLLTATVRFEKAAGATRVHVSPELVEVAAAGAPTSRWQQPFEAELTGVFEVEADLARQVADALGVALAQGDHARLGGQPTRSLAAYDAFLRGEALTGELADGSVDDAGVRQGLAAYQEAVAIDPSFAQAWARLSQTILHVRGEAESAHRVARRAAERAVALAPDRPEGYNALGMYEWWVKPWNTTRALTHYTQAHRVDPRNAEAVAQMAALEAILDRQDEAIAHYREAERLDPRREDVPGLASLLFNIGRYAESRAAYDRALAFDPARFDLIAGKADNDLAEGDLAGARALLRSVPDSVDHRRVVAHEAVVQDRVWVLEDADLDVLLRITPQEWSGPRAGWALCMVQAYERRGDAAKVRQYAEEARVDYEQILRVSPDDADSQLYLAITLAYLGRKEEALHRVAGLWSLFHGGDRADRPGQMSAVAWIHVLLGEHEKAIDDIESSPLKTGWLAPGMLRIDPRFAPLRGKARFERLIADKASSTAPAPPTTGS